MKEFEKRFGPDHGVTTSSGGNYHNCIEYVWRAALEWAITQRKPGDDKDDAWDRIDDELES